MNLWIRSQDKKQLTKTTNLEVDFNKHEESNKKWQIVSRLGIDHYNQIGGYETKERALEVLDDINRHIESMLVYGNPGIGTFVYKMPKE